MALVSNAVLLRDVRKVCLKYDSTRSTYRVFGQFASDTVERRFGSWNNAVRCAKRASR